MKYDLLLKGGIVVTPFQKQKIDIGVKDGKIAAMGSLDDAEGKIVNCSGLHILPGAIDMHVHFREPGAEYKEDFKTGSEAAVSGGITTVADMPNTNPMTITAKLLTAKQKLARIALCNVLFYIGFDGENFDEIVNAKNACGVKLFMAYSHNTGAVAELDKIERLLTMGKLVVVHAEDEDIIQKNAAKFENEHNPGIHSLVRPPEAAYEAVRKILHLAKKHNARIHITHISTKKEVEEIAKFKANGNITCDATPHHLFLNETAYATLGCFAKVNPPLRHEADRKALWKAIRNGVIDCIATDHAPHTKQEKQQDYWDAPAGVPGEETMLPLLLDAVNHGELQLQDVARLIAQSPAEILKLSDRGSIEIGNNADLVIVDMNLQKSVGKDGYATKCGWSPFHGRKLTGWPVITIVNGKVVMKIA